MSQNKYTQRQWLDGSVPTQPEYIDHISRRYWKAQAERFDIILKELDLIAKRDGLNNINEIVAEVVRRVRAKDSQ